jgi:hypothetical protein
VGEKIGLGWAGYFDKHLGYVVRVAVGVWVRLSLLSQGRLGAGI